MSHRHNMDFDMYFLDVYIDLVKVFSVKTVLRHYNKLHIAAFVRWKVKLQQINLYRLNENFFGNCVYISSVRRYLDINYLNQYIYSFCCDKHHDMLLSLGYDIKSCRNRNPKDEYALKCSLSDCRLTATGYGFKSVL